MLARVQKYRSVRLWSSNSPAKKKRDGPQHVIQKGNLCSNKTTGSAPRQDNEHVGERLGRRELITRPQTNSSRTCSEDPIRNRKYHFELVI
jgi:hypothetical protein